jgi:hypothetical protein
MPDDIYPGPVLPSSLKELVAVAQALGANILEVPPDTPVLLELIGPVTLILAYPADVDLGKEGVEDEPNI